MKNITLLSFVALAGCQKNACEQYVEAYLSCYAEWSSDDDYREDPTFEEMAKEECSGYRGEQDDIYMCLAELYAGCDPDLFHLNTQQCYEATGTSGSL